MVIDSNKLTIEEHIYLTNIRLVKNRYREEYNTYKELYENQMIVELPRPVEDGDSQTKKKF